MTTTNPVATSTNTASQASTTANKTLAGNFQTFLSMLTTQLKNQDPTSPMDSNQFTQQLVMYSQVEQQISTNDNLNKLISLSQNQANNLAMGYLGKTVVLSDGSGLLQSGSATWSYGLDNDAKTSMLTIKDASGKAVYSKSYTAPADNTAGLHAFTWDGKDMNGEQLPDGMYTMVVSAGDSNGSKVTTSIASKAQVSGVDLSGTSPQLVIGNTEVPLTSATLITN